MSTAAAHPVPQSGSLAGRLNRRFNPAIVLRRRLRLWFESRLPLSDHIVLTQRSVYILPTRPGLMLVVTLLTLLVASINYQLNLGYLLTFLLAGCALVGMHVCHGTLRGLAMYVVAPTPNFAGATAIIDVKLTNSRRSVRHGIGLSVLDTRRSHRSSDPSRECSPPAPASETGTGHWAWTDVAAQGSSVVQVAFSPGRRGLHRLPTLTAETRFPLGTFRVWTVWRPAAQMLVYPVPEVGAPPLPPGEPRSGGAAAARRAQSSGEFDGVRGYRRGDPIKLVIWKKAAKADENIGAEHGGLIVRDAQQIERHELWLDLAQAGAVDAEHKLSRLCAWVLQADKLGLDYGLRLPALEIKPCNGEAHRRQCLEALALC
ncbi:MAG: hypothetical protein JWP47_3251 [Polaromonas sp.]|nr:hypothetical protein [Polaromonas sp.]